MKPQLPSADEWTELGTHLVQRSSRSFTFHDLTRLKSPILPAVNQAGLHHYKIDGKLMTTSYAIESFLVETYEGADRTLSALSEDGVVYLLCMFSSPHHAMMLRAVSVPIPSEYSYFRPDSPRAILDQIRGNRKMDLSMYPHLCPFCGSKAFIGFNQVDCMEACR